MKQSAEAKSPYLKYGLIRNPFPSIPITPIWSYSPFYEKIFENELRRLEEFALKLRNRNPQVVFIVGNRGCGKSAFLKFFLKNCQKHKSVTSVFMKFGLTDAFAPLYRSTLWWLGINSLHEVCVTKSQKHGLPKYFADFKRDPNSAYVNLLFMGDNLKFPVLVELLNLFAEDTDIIIGIDGFDNIFQLLTNYQRTDLLYGFNRLMEGIDGNVTLLMNARNNLLVWLKENQIYLESLGVHTTLIDPIIISVPNLTLDQAYIIVSSFLKEYRIYDFTKNELFPFTKETLGWIYKESEGNLRKLLLLCRDLLSFALSLNYPRVEEEVITKYVSLYRTKYFQDDYSEKRKINPKSR